MKLMKLSAATGVGILSLLLGIPAAMHAQDEPKQQEEPKVPKQEEPKAPKQEQAKPESGRQDEVKPPKQENVKPPKQEKSNPSRSAEEPGRAEQAQGARPSSKSGHIPDKQFRAHFGRGHTVVINQPVIVEGQPRFQYGGYWFVITDPWPGDWAYTDQCYIDYIDGEYFLFDLLHPGVRIALFVVM
jgi:hypothetical protein